MRITFFGVSAALRETRNENTDDSTTAAAKHTNLRLRILRLLIESDKEALARSAACPIENDFMVLSPVPMPDVHRVARRATRVSGESTSAAIAVPSSRQMADKSDFLAKDSQTHHGIWSVGQDEWQGNVGRQANIAGPCEMCSGPRIALTVKSTRRHSPVSVNRTCRPARVRPWSTAADSEEANCRCGELAESGTAFAIP